MATITTAQQHYFPQLPRIKGKTVDLFDLLRDQKWHTNYACFEAGGLSFQSRLYALRRLGYQIDSRYVKPGLWEYRLVGWAPVSTVPRLSRPQQRVVRDLEDAIREEFGEDGLRRLRRQLPPRYVSDGEETSAGPGETP